MADVQVSFMETSDLQESVGVLSLAMLNNPLHVALFQVNGETERLHIEKAFLDFFSQLPGVVYLAKENRKIVGVLRMKSCVGTQVIAKQAFSKKRCGREWKRRLL